MTAIQSLQGEASPSTVDGVRAVADVERAEPSTGAGELLSAPRPATCSHRYLDALDGSPCTILEHPLNPGGHVYAGANVPDKHDASETAAEVTRG